ncbi:translocase of chloroplast 159, chloroplastic-like [Ananas comosus]|uniref:Translocase of chloroplast 159, chloroplastic-like n=1 Tax=Ananas comosus TaxID=4615 RepID=A0A6P5H0F1_ANACO|nr:translocase of chloroplast 159, chloroplastic-like [Ananas comosus]
MATAHGDDKELLDAPDDAPVAAAVGGGREAGAESSKEAVALDESPIEDEGSEARASENPLEKGDEKPIEGEADGVGAVDAEEDGDGGEEGVESSKAAAVAEAEAGAEAGGAVAAQSVSASAAETLGMDRSAELDGSIIPNSMDLDADFGSGEKLGVDGAEEAEKVEGLEGGSEVVGGGEVDKGFTGKVGSVDSDEGFDDGSTQNREIERVIVQNESNRAPDEAKADEVEDDEVMQSVVEEAEDSGSEEVKAMDVGNEFDAKTNLEPVSDAAAEAEAVAEAVDKFSGLDGRAGETEKNEGLDGGSVLMGSNSDADYADKVGNGNGDEVTANVGEAEKAGSSEIAEGSSDKVDSVKIDAEENSSITKSPETEGEKATNESDQVAEEAEAVEPKHDAGEKSREEEMKSDFVDNSTAKKGGDDSEEPSENLTATIYTEKEGKAGDHGPFDPADDEENGDNETGGEEDEVFDSERLPRVAILESSETAKEIMKEFEGGSSRDIDGQIVIDSDEEVDEEDDDEEGDEKEVFDSAALAALLKAATGSSPDGSFTLTTQDGARVFSVNRPAGLGSSVPSLRPAPARPARQDLSIPSELALAADPLSELNDEEKKLHEKVELIRVKFLRLVYRLGHSPDDTVAAQVLYRLSLAEGIRRGRQMHHAFSLENAKKKALQLEAERKEDLNFACNILVLGKTGVGKSATINSIFGEEKSLTNAFEPATASVREITGSVDGVNIRVIDTPGLRTSLIDQASNRRILSSIKKYTKKCPPDIVLYVDRMDTQTRDLNDLPLLRTITSTLGSSIWFNAIVALTHAASAPPDGPNGSPLSYEVFVAQRSHVVQQSVRQAAGDMRLMNPVALVENHPSCRRNREGQRVLPNGLSWRQQLLLLCYSSKILSEANSLLKLQDPSPGKLFGFRFRSPPLPFLLSSLLQSRAHPKLSSDQGGDNGDSDIDLDDFSDAEQEEEEDEYDQLPPFKPLKKSQIAKLTKEQRRAYFDEYEYRVKLLQKKQWKEELRRLKEMKKRGKTTQDDFGYGDYPEDYDQDNAPAAVPVPLPDMVLPPSFDCDSPTYRYRFLEPTSQLLARPVLDTHGWDHDCGYDGVSLEETLALASQFPAAVSVQVTKDKKEFSIHLESSVSAKHGENGSSLAGFDIQTVGKQIAYILRGESKFKNLKRNKTTGGVSVTFLGDIVATGLKVEDQLSIGKRLTLVASTGGVRAQGDTAYGANLEARLKDKDYPIGQALSTLGLSLMKWRGDLAVGANLQSQFAIGRGSKMAVRLGLNNKLSGQITVKTSTSEQLQIALLGILPIAMSIFKSVRPGESFAY